MLILTDEGNEAGDRPKELIAGGKTQTDAINEAEIAEFKIGLAVNLYRGRLGSGKSKSAARMEALNYLRRKLKWDLAITAGALDTAIQERDIMEALERTEELDGVVGYE